jgi:hypothetical protein
MSTSSLVARLAALCLGLVIGLHILATSAASPTEVTAYDCAGQSAIPQPECAALVALYNANPGASFNANWLQTGSSPCTWTGITCAGGSVTEIQLTGIGLTNIPASINALTKLAHLGLDQNQLTGAPTQIGTLADLQFLDLSNNQMVSVPVSIGNLTKLDQLWLNNNQLVSVPAGVSNLVSLTVLSLHQNQLTTAPNVQSLARLTTFSLNDNQLALAPIGIGNLVSLTQLPLSRNLLVTVPAEIGNLAGLTSLSLNENHLIAVPGTITGLAQLSILDLSNNQLMTVSSSIGALSNLTELYVGANPITGPLPSALLTLNLLETFWFQNTGLCVPNTPAYTSWLAGITSVNPTNAACLAPRAFLPIALNP